MSSDFIFMSCVKNMISEVCGVKYSHRMEAGQMKDKEVEYQREQRPNESEDKHGETLQKAQSLSSCFSNCLQKNKAFF